MKTKEVDPIEKAIIDFVVATNGCTAPTLVDELMNNQGMDFDECNNMDKVIEKLVKQGKIVEIEYVTHKSTITRSFYLPAKSKIILSL